MPDGSLMVSVFVLRLQILSYWTSKNVKHQEGVSLPYITLFIFLPERNLPALALSCIPPGEHMFEVG